MSNKGDRIYQKANKIYFESINVIIDEFGSKDVRNEISYEINECWAFGE
ncbi:hypothetical protein OAD28_01260 [Flavobacteriales bacterium]|nr:hypothetical protein [Flavobacteriales bacterium]